MKAIIIAAGIGSRLLPLTEDRPKCMSELNGKPLLEYQANILREAGIKDISIVRGYKKEKIFLPGWEFKYYQNEDFLNNNILESLFCAEQEINGEVIILYSDIIFTRNVLEALLRSKETVSIAVDVDWENNYINRSHHPFSEAENVIFDQTFHVKKIGKSISQNKKRLSGEFIGMMKLCGQGVETFKEVYYDSRKKYSNGPFQRAKSFRKAYLTDLIQELVDKSVKVFCVKINNGWKEIDTLEDHENAVGFSKDLST